jgi:hypothetical protein
MATNLAHHLIAAEESEPATNSSSSVLVVRRGKGMGIAFNMLHKYLYVIHDIVQN